MIERVRGMIMSRNSRLLYQKLEEKKHLIAVHRGCCGANIIQNTVNAFNTAFKMNGDMAEMDVIKSIDGVFYVFHDGTEKLNLNIEANIRTLSSREIDELYYYNEIGSKTSFKVERLDQVIKSFKDGELYNIDRAWDDFEELIDFLDKYDVAEQLLLKAPAKEEVLKVLDAKGARYMFMPIVYKLEEIEEVLSYKNINTVAVELIAKTKEHEFFKDEIIQDIKEKGLLVWVNAITLDCFTDLYAGCDDNVSIVEHPDKGWGILIDKGIDIIQTDWPSLLAEYRDKKVK